MANIDAAFGLRPYRILGSGANTNGIATYKIQTSGTAGTSSVIYEGTPVIPLANGLIDIVGAAAGGRHWNNLIPVFKIYLHLLG